MSDQPAYYVMACPHCQSHLRVPSQALGSQRKCPCCQGAVTIPQEIRRSQSPTGVSPGEAAKSHARDEFGFSCRLCGSRLFATPAQIGQRIQCTDCHAMNVVREREVLVERKVFSSDEDELKLQETADAASPDSPSYPVKCRVCDTTVYCRAEQQGKQVICPDCDSLVLVPPPPPPKPKRKLNDVGPPIDIAPTFDLPVQKTNSDKLLASAHEKVAEQERKKPKPPKRPFVDGVLSFPFYLRVMPAWLVVAFLAGVVMKLLTLGIELAQSQSLDTFIGIPVMAAFSVLGVATMLIAGNVYMTIVYWTAMGYPTVEDWGGVDLWGWVRRAFFFINALAVSCVPGAIASIVLPGRALDFIASGIGIFVLFPYLLLCMLDEESPVTVYSAYIWQTTRLVRPAWKKFYLLTGTIVLAAVGLQLATLAASWATGVTWLNYLPLVLLAVASVWYFRLLGRLAWVLDEFHANLSDDEEGRSVLVGW